MSSILRNCLVLKKRYILLYLSKGHALKKGEFMQKSRELGSLILLIGAIFVLTSCGEEAVQEKPETSFENPVDTYIDSRVDAMQSARSVVKKENRRIKAQEKAMDALLK